MNLWQKSLTWLIGGATVLFVGLQIVLYFSFSDMCGNEIWAEYPSPDGELKAVVFERSCGATTSFSTQLSILPADSALPNDAGNIYVVKGRTGEVAPIISWADDNVLNVSPTFRRDESIAADLWESSALLSSRSVEVRYDP